jgi:hypothetical protein
LMALLTWQALRGQSVIAPDGLTLATLAGLLGLSAMATGLVVTRGRGKNLAA